MLITKITSFSGFASNTANRANAQNNVTFAATTPMVLPADVIKLTNRVVGMLAAPVRDAYQIFDGRQATTAERFRALEVIRNGITLKAPVEISGKQRICKTHIRQSEEGHELCMDIGEGKKARRYKIELNFDEKGKVTNSSELKLQKLENESNPPDFISLKDQNLYTTTVSTCKMLLEAFVKN
jgi:hypothetical protein